MNGDRPIDCRIDGLGRVWRVQCDEATRICLVAPDAELDGTGKWIRPLERTVKDCVAPFVDFDRAALEAKGYTVSPGLAEAPYGWMRDERQRVFQVIFDLHRRMWFGASYTPAVNTGDPRGDDEWNRFAFDIGLLEWQDYEPGTGDAGTRHRLRIGVAEVRLAPFSMNTVLLHYDLSHRYETPLLRLTTFFGTPRRSDMDLAIGFWVEAGDLEVHRAGDGNETQAKIATVDGTLDLWQSPDLTSFVRIRAGVGVEHTFGIVADERSAITPGAALEADLTLDRDGFHHLTGIASWEAPQWVASPASVGTSATRLRAEIGFETIVLAINDQPITVRLATGVSRRDDIPGITAEWAYTATAGLRLSLWAPTRQPIK